MELLLKLEGQEYEIEKLVKHILQADKVEYALELSRKEEIEDRDVLEFFQYYKSNLEVTKADFEADLVLDLELFAYIVQEEYLGNKVLLSSIGGIFNPAGDLALLIRKVE